jgi:hypothetical protein
MKKFLIEVPHKNNKSDCEKAIRIFLQTGSHFLNKADWGCTDGEHKAWIVVEVPRKEDARNIIPPLYRSTAKIVELSTFDMEESVKYHKESSRGR